MLKRVFLFFLTNVLVLLTLQVIFAVLSSTTPLGAWMQNHGQDMQSLLVFCFFWGMGGSFISLLISRWMAKRATSARMLDESTVRGEEAWLLATVHRLAREAGIKVMPEVG